MLVQQWRTGDNLGYTRCPKWESRIWKDLIQWQWIGFTFSCNQLEAMIILRHLWQESFWSPKKIFLDESLSQRTRKTWPCASIHEVITWREERQNRVLLGVTWVNGHERDYVSRLTFSVSSVQSPALLTDNELLIKIAATLVDDDDEETIWRKLQPSVRRT